MNNPAKDVLDLVMGSVVQRPQLDACAAEEVPS